MRSHPIKALRAAAQARRSRRWRRDVEDVILDSAHAAAERELAPRGTNRVPFRALPVYRQSCAATGVHPARTVLPDMHDVLAHLDALAAPLRPEPFVAPALWVNAVAEREHRTAVTR